MDHAETQALVSQHLRAEGRGDVDGAIAKDRSTTSNTMSAGYPGSPHRGKDGARKFDDELTTNLRIRG